MVHFLKDEFSEYQMKDFPSGVEWAVVNYEVGSYDGSGDMVVKKEDRKSVV